MGDLDVIVALRDYFEQGGDVLWGILFVTILLWTFIIERYWYFFRVHPQRMDALLAEWKKRDEYHSWHAHRIRERMVSEVAVDAHQGVLAIKTFIAVLPLMGLLGTVTGMIEVFEVMAVMGTGNARAMAGGVSKATIPTMSGMVAALSGLYFSHALEKRAKREVDTATDLLRHE